MIKYYTPSVNSVVIPAQAGIHKAVRGLTAGRFRLQATGMTRWVTTEMSVWDTGGMTRVPGLVRITKQSLQAGFTLLEMLLVLFLVGLMASATLMLTENVEDQAKYDETKRRMDIMRKAIVGDPTRTVNGGPEISGFVADMGRLPNCVRELLEQIKCDGSPLLPAWSIEPSTGLGFGWRGPYIQVLPERNGNLRLRDGYANSDLSTTIDAKNSGWKVFGVSATDISVASDSFNMADTSDDIVVDPLIVSADWEVQLPATVNVTFQNQSANNLPTVDTNIVLRIYLSDLSSAIEGDDSVNDYLTLNASSAISGIPKTKNFTLTSTPTLPIGNRAYSIVCYEVPATGDPDDYKIFDGDCDLGNPIQSTSNIRIFSVTPRQNLNLNLDWIIQ